MILQSFATDGEELCVDRTNTNPECSHIILKMIFQKRLMGLKLEYILVILNINLTYDAYSLNLRLDKCL